MRKTQGLDRKNRRRPWWARVSALGQTLFLVWAVAACLPTASPPASPPPTATALPSPVTPPPWEALDATWGPYLAEREWGNPREAVSSGDGWSFTYEKALSTPYRFGEDGIAGLTDRDLGVALAFAFFRSGQPYLTERLHGLDGPGGEYGETIVEDRVFYENTPTHSYMRYGYTYPFQADFANATIEYAKRDNGTMVAQVTLTGLANAASATLHLVPEVWLHTGGEVLRTDERTWDAVYPGGHFVVLADRAPDSWQITANEVPIRAAINAALVNDDVLANSGTGNKAAWDFTVKLAPGETTILRFGLAHAPNLPAARVAAEEALAQAGDLLSMRQVEAQSLYVDDVTAHRTVYQAALMNLLWNKMYYAYDGSYQPEWRGKVEVHDVILVPDKWEFPWPAMWDTCFQAKVATLADVGLAKHDLQLFLSDRWQTHTGHVPNVEWSLEGETPPLFAWAAWQVYQADRDRTFLEELFPRLEMHYAFVRKAYDRDRDNLHTGGFMGMDNIPRPGPPDPEEADLSGWVAFFARDMARIAAEIGQPERASFYQAEYDRIVAEINAQLWNPETGFYYDRNGQSLLLEKSYAGLIPLIAGVPEPAQAERIISHLTDPAQFWTPYGIRSLSADSAIYEPGYSQSGWKNSNWCGPIWLPINYLLVQRLQETHPDVAEQLRQALIANVEAQWQASGRYEARGGAQARAADLAVAFYYGYDADTLYVRVDARQDWAGLGNVVVGLYVSVPGVSSPIGTSRYGAGAGQPTLLGFNATHLAEVSLADGVPSEATLSTAGGSLTDPTWLDPVLLERAATGDRILEMAIPLDALGKLRAGDALRLSLVVSQNGRDAQQLPSGGLAQLVLPDLSQIAWFLVVDDPGGDDNGPGTYTYPTDVVFEPGVFDLKQFRAGVGGSDLVFRFQIDGPIDNAWGSGIGLSVQTFDIYLDTDPGAGTGARLLLEGRNAALEAGNGWDYAVWVEGWSQKVLRPAASGAPVEIAGENMQAIVDPTQRTVTLRLPLALFGEGADPTRWGYTATLLSQDGFPSPGVRRVRDVLLQAQQWRIGGGPNDTNHTRMMDLAWPAGAAATQSQILGDYPPSQETDMDALSPDDFAQLPMLTP